MTQELALKISDTTPTKDLVAQYNRLAGLVNKPVVKKFENRSVAIRRLTEITETARATFVPATPKPNKRQKSFNYPPLETLKALKPGTLRAEACELLKRGATVARIEQLVADWDRREGKTPHRLEPRAYGLIRLLHSYIGYALREEGKDDKKIIYVMTAEEWKAWKGIKK